MTKTKIETNKDIPNFHRNEAEVRAANLAMESDIELIRARHSDFHFIHNVRQRKSAEGRMECEIDTMRRRGRRYIEDLNETFRTRWFLWRSAISVSPVVGIRPENILYGPQSTMYSNPRRLCLWITWTASKDSYNHIGKTIGMDVSTVRTGCVIVGRALEEGAEPFTEMFHNALQLEEENEFTRTRTDYIRSPDRG